MTENPHFTILKKSLSKDFDLSEVLEIVSLIAVEYDDDTYKALLLAIKENELVSFSKRFSFNSSKDAIYLYWIKNKDRKNQLYILFSPVEYFMNEYIMDMIEYPLEIDFIDFKEAKIICKNINI